ncbi:unnamed protein product [Cuscuta campestris]|uniref:Uncharacterized protein n=1 Tax=Cuscuta campestris TaxID=132261 RepID=A0A484K4F1_9ASTE|nr:unnamed protein product [Cuscuta campestris]
MDPQEKQNPAPSNCIISLPFHAPPFFLHLFRQRNSKPSAVHLLKAAEDSSRQFQSSAVSSAHGCLRSLHFLFSHHPFINKLLFLSSRLQGLSQIQRSKGCKNIKVISTGHNFAAILPGDSVAGVVVANGVLNFLNIYNSLLVVRLVLTWFPNVPPAIVTPLSTLCDPYLNVFRGIIPPLGGTLDLSPILAFLVLNAFTSAAAALPAELPPTGLSQNHPTTHTMEPAHRRTTTSQEKWMRRLAAGNRLRTGFVLMEEGRRQMVMRSSSNEHKLLAIALTLVAIISPIYIDRRRRKASTGRQSDPDEETLTGGPSASFLLLLLIVVSVAAAAATATRGAIRLASYRRPGAIALAVVAVLSPLYINREESEEEAGKEGAPFGNGFVQLFVLMGLVVAIALSCYFDRSFTRFDPYWIHRVGGSSTGILILLLVLASVLKLKAY